MEISPLRVLIVEDDYVIARSLRSLLTRLGYTVTGAAPTAELALTLFDAQPPDLVLLDVELADGSDGIELAHQLNQRRQLPLLFLTAFTDRATFERAKAAGPCAFLNKPYDETLLGNAIELAAQQFARAQAPAPGADASADLLMPDAVWLREGSRLLRLELAELRWLEADSSYLHLHTAARKHTVRMSFRELLERLPPAQFVRIHRSYVVNVAALDSVDPGRGEVLLRSGERLALGPSYRDDLLRRLPQLGG
jgi:DNA-binding LytR/AlgR family response regulator